MILFLYGKDTFRSRQQLQKMIEKFKADRDPSGMNVVRLDCEKQPEADQVLEQILAIPFLAERRMVVVENLLASKNADLKAEILKRVEEKTIPESTVAVFWEGTDTFKTKDAKEMLERLSKEKYAQAFDVLSGAKLSGWIAAEIQARGGKIEPQALGFLAEHVGADMWKLHSLIDQLVAYVASPLPLPTGQAVSHNLTPSPSPKGEGNGDSTSADTAGEVISIAHVRQFVDEKADENIFNLIDAIVAKQPKKVFAMIEQQYKNGEDGFAIFSKLVWQYRILTEIKDMVTREPGITSDAIAKKIGIHPFVAKKSLPIVHKYSFAELRRIYDRLLETDIGVKTGQSDMETLVDLFVGRVSAV